MIHLVNMPFASLLRPAYALGQFKAQLASAGLESRVFNFNFDFALKAGVKQFELVALMRGVDSQLGEWLFADEAWGGSVGPTEDEFLALCEVDMKEQGLPAGRKLRPGRLDRLMTSLQWLKKLRHEVVPGFLDGCVEQLLRTGPIEVVGFGCTFFQTIASFALMKRIKKAVPDARIVFGGACFHGEMGAELIAKVQEISAVSTGEADDVVVPLFAALKERRDPSGLQGVLFRRASDGAVVAGPPHTPVSSSVLEALPDPNFDEYFVDLARSGLTPQNSKVFIPFESSRGCWWGQKQHCTFCGLNGEGMEFREKSPERVVSMLKGLHDRYKVRRFNATDNILPPGYYAKFLPKLRDEPAMADTEIFYEIKANISRERAAALRAGHVVHLQPGIESLSTHHLDLMKKGVTGLQNVFFLKLGRVFDLTIIWNMLIRIPGETARDYDEVCALLPKIVHFSPPYGGPREVELHRFSPYHFDKGRWTESVRPRVWYAGLFPKDRVDLSRVAYYFDCEWKDTLGAPAYDEVIDLTEEWIETWAKASSLPRLSWEEDLQGCLYITDTRGGEDAVYRLTEEESAVYGAIDDPCSAERIVRERGAEVGPLELVKRTLDEFVERGLAIEENGTYLGLALHVDVPEPTHAFRSQQFLADWTSKPTSRRRARRAVASVRSRA
jgi:ribosomal peptide maturation radical SAM protein 1